jgi:hypothetical protein
VEGKNAANFYYYLWSPLVGQRTAVIKIGYGGKISLDHKYFIAQDDN